MTFTFFWNDVSKVVKRHKKYQVCWMSIEILASKRREFMGTYRHLSRTVLSCIVSCAALLSLMLVTGDRDLPVLTSDNWVIKCWVIRCETAGRLRFFTFSYALFCQNPKPRLFTLLSCCTRFLEHWFYVQFDISITGQYHFWRRLTSLSIQSRAIILTINSKQTKKLAKIPQPHRF